MTTPQEPVRRYAVQSDDMAPDSPGFDIYPHREWVIKQADHDRLMAGARARLNELSDWGNLYEKMRAFIDDFASHEYWQFNTGSELDRLIQEARKIRDLDAALSPKQEGGEK